jgi:hypothetical protein
VPEAWEVEVVVVGYQMLALIHFEHSCRKVQEALVVVGVVGVYFSLLVSDCFPQSKQKRLVVSVLLFHPVYQNPEDLFQSAFVVMQQPNRSLDVYRSYRLQSEVLL